MFREVIERFLQVTFFIFFLYLRNERGYREIVVSAHLLEFLTMWAGIR
jgi:hypothetical protein